MSTPQIAPEPSLEGLSFLWLEITAKCNLECMHCYADAGPQERLFGMLNGDDWLAILREAAGLGCRQVQFIGGEPTLHPGLPRMIRFARAHGYEFIEVYTNATHITDELLRVFVDEGVHLAVSFYSDDPEVHDAITQRRGSFQRTVANLRKIGSAGLPVRTGIIEMQQNRGHGERALRFLAEMGITDAKVDGRRGIGRGATVEIGARANPMAELCGECWKGKLCVTSAGAVYPCVFSRFAQVGTANDGVAALLDGDALASFRRELREYRHSPTSFHDAGCNPTCSPCQPDLYKCVPKPPATLNSGNDEIADCNPSRCAPCAPDYWRDQAPKCTPNSSLRGAPVKLAGRHASCRPTCVPPPDWRKPKPQCAPADPRQSAACNPRCSPPGPWPDQPEPQCVPASGNRRSLQLSSSRAGGAEKASNVAPEKVLPCEG
jgi:uncharacterized Fe-S cluster-containing radical SAM superfamily protein